MVVVVAVVVVAGLILTYPLHIQENTKHLRQRNERNEKRKQNKEKVKEKKIKKKGNEVDLW